MRGCWMSQARQPRHLQKALCLTLALGVSLLVIAGSCPGAHAASLGSDALQGGTPTLKPTIPVIPTPQVQEPKPPPVVQSPESARTCPPTRILDCMPKVNERASPLCNDQKYLDWAKASCPGFQVVY